MKKNRKKRIRNGLIAYIRHHHLGIASMIISIILSLFLFSINRLNNQYIASLEESWRKALSKSIEINTRGGKAHPIRLSDGYGVSCESGGSVQVTCQISSTVTFIKANQTLQPNIESSP